MVFLHNCKEKAQNKQIKKTQTSLNPVSKNIYFVEHLRATASDGSESVNSEKDDEL